LKTARRAAVCLLPLGLIGCAVGPNYTQPSVAVPAAYKEQPSPPGEEEWKPAAPSDERSRGNWWQIFQDPRLDALEEQVGVSNQNIAQAYAQFQGSRAPAKVARADLFPTLSVAPSVTRARTSPNRGLNPSPAGTQTTYQLAGAASYEVDVWGRIRRNVESAVENAQASDADLEAVRLSMQADLALDYFLLEGVDSQIQLLTASVGAYEKTLQLTVNRHDQGLVSGVDVAQAETQLETTRAQLTELQLTRAELEHAIAILVGKPPAEMTIVPSAIPTSPPPVPAGVPSALLERRPDIAAAERSVAAANAQIGVAQAGFFPSLVLAATGGWARGSLSNLISAPNLFWSLGAALAQTIFEGGKRIAAKQQAVASYEAAVASYRETVLTSFQDVEDNLAALRVLTEEFEQQEKAVSAAERSLTLSRDRYQAGVAPYLEVLTAQFAELSNARTAVDLQTRRMTATVNLIRALGGGWESSDLAGPSSILGHGSDKASPKN
jgi:NodT family efflux transporter outer membrane factor (OMF) lipoprotein